MRKRMKRHLRWGRRVLADELRMARLHVYYNYSFIQWNEDVVWMYSFSPLPPLIYSCIHASVFHTCTLILSSAALNPDNDIIIAYEMAGEDISRDHGFPLRAILPGYIGVCVYSFLSPHFPHRLSIQVSSCFFSLLLLFVCFVSISLFDQFSFSFFSR